MEEKESYFRNEIKEIVFYVFLVVLMGIIIPLVFGFGFRGFEDSFIKGQPLKFGDFLPNFIIYYIIILGGLGLIIFQIGKLVSIRRGEHPATQQPVSWFRIFTVGIIHNPEENGILYRIGEWFKKEGWFKFNFMGWSKSILRVIIIGTILFSGIGILHVVFPNGIWQFSDVPQLIIQQVAPSTKVIFATEPAAISETTLMLFIYSIFLGGVAYVSAKFKLGLPFFFVVGVLLCPLMGFIWMNWHNFAYPDSGIARTATFMWGTIGPFLTILFGTFLFFYLWHFWNNFFTGIAKVAPGNIDVIFISILSWVILTVSYIWIEILLYRRRKRKRMQVSEGSF